MIASVPASVAFEQAREIESLRSHLDASVQKVLRLRESVSRMRHAIEQHDCPLCLAVVKAEGQR